MKQPKKDGADLEHSIVAPNYYYASTETGVKQMSKDADLIIWNDNDIKRLLSFRKFLTPYILAPNLAVAIGAVK